MTLMSWNDSCYQRKKCKVLTGSFTVYHDSFMTAFNFFGGAEGNEFVITKRSGNEKNCNSR